VGAMEEDGKFRVEKFNGQKYQLWKMKMEYYLYQNDLFLPLVRIEKNSMTMKDEEWEVLDRKALGTI
jgi:RecA-family ATPase